MSGVSIVSESHPFDWRLPVPILPLEKFDLPGMHERSKFSPGNIASMSNSRMAGSAIRRSPDQIRDLIRSGEMNKDDRAYLRGLIVQFDCEDIRRFTMQCGVSRYEMARAMIACDIRHHQLAEWINGHVPGYQLQRNHHRTWDLTSRI